jgi:hypothetical protein
VTTPYPQRPQPARAPFPQAPAPYAGPVHMPAQYGSAPVPYPAPQVSGLAPKRRNPVGVWIGLPLVTLGIYSLVWYYKIHREMAELDRRRHVPVAGPLLVILFLSWTVVAPFVSMFNTGRRIADAQRSAGLAPTASPWVGLLLCFLFGLQTLYYQAELNKIADAFGVPAGTPVPLRGPAQA